jgi:hypothetical protein
VIVSADDFFRLLHSQDSQVGRQARFDEAPIDVWLEVIDRYPEERVAVVLNKSVPLAVLEILVDDPDVDVRYLVAMKRKLSPGLLEHLSRDVDESIRMRVAQHRSTSRETLNFLLDDPWIDIRTSVGERLRAQEGDLPRPPSTGDC